MKWVLAILSLPVFCFCLFGFLATYEPGIANAIIFRIVYAMTGFGCFLIMLQPFFFTSKSE